MQKAGVSGGSTLLTNQQQVAISEIKIGKRFRKDAGDISSLVQSIEEVDLLHPIVIDEENNLVAGFRRIQACLKLGWKNIPIHRISIDEPKIGEFHENTIRKDFTISEIADITEYVEASRINHRPQKGSESAPLPKGKTNDVVEKMTGISHDTINKIKTIKNTDRKILEKIDSGKGSINSEYNKIMNEKRITSSKKCKLPTGQYNIFYIDPPWQYDNENTGGSLSSGAAQKYPTMSTDEIIAMFKKMPFAKDSVIFMWATNSMLPDALRIFSEIGFSYKGKITWRKKEFLGLGYWFRNITEDCLFAIKGDIRAFKCQLPNFIEAKPGQHSEKPDEMRQLIEEAVKNIHPKKKIELFARKESTKWISWGNEI